MLRFLTKVKRDAIARRVLRLDVEDVDDVTSPANTASGAYESLVKKLFEKVVTGAAQSQRYTHHFIFDEKSCSVVITD